MDIQIVGGPRDGEVLKYDGTATTISFPKLNLGAVLEQGPVPKATINVLNLPVRRRRNGTYFVQWRH